MSEYEKRAKEFLKRIGAKVTITFVGCDFVPDWDDHYMHNTYRVRVDRGGKSWSYLFHDSANNTNRNVRPNVYDVLSCVEKYDPGTIDDFVSEFGYEVHSWSDVKKIERIYHAVKKEAANFARLFGDVADKMAEVFA